MTRQLLCQSLVTFLLGTVGVSSAQPEPAPPPQDKFTPAELLVGRWRLVKFGEKDVPEAAMDILIFTTKGQFSSTYTRSGSASRSAGAYRLLGSDIEFSTQPPEQPMTERLKLIDLSKNRLILQLGEKVDFRRAEYIRDEGKK